MVGFYSAHSQDFIAEFKKMTLINDSLQNQVIKPLQDSLLKVKNSNPSDVVKLQGQVNILEKDKENLNKKIKDLEKDIAILNKTTVKTERDSLLKLVERLRTNIAELNQKMQDKDVQINTEKQNCEQRAKNERENGKKDILEKLVSCYTNKKFDDLIKTTTKLSVQRDMQFVKNNDTVKLVLSDLETYFIAEELLAKKIDAVQIKNMQIQLGQIKQQSILLDKLKENIEYYKNYNEELKKAINNLVDLDKRKVAGSDTEIRNMKFQNILSELANYMYNYYDYANYPYLSGIVLEIIVRKKPNADANISDLLIKL